MHEERLKRRERMAEVATFPLQAMQEKPVGGDKDFDEQPSFRNLRYQTAKRSHSLNDNEGELSYKNFVLAHDDDNMTPEASAKAYRIYKRIYTSLRDGAEHCRRINNFQAILMVKFVSKNMLTPWFKDRYNPEQKRMEYIAKSKLVAEAHKTFMEEYPHIPELKMNIITEHKEEEPIEEEKPKREFVGPQSSLAEKAARGIKTLGRFFHNCVVLPHVPIRVTKEDIRKVLKRYEGVRRIFFGAPEIRMVRTCYIIMRSQNACSSLILNEDLGGLNGLKASPLWTVEALSCRPSTIRRPKSAPQATLKEERLQFDTERMLKLIEILSERYVLNKVDEALKLFEEIDKENVLLRCNFALAYLRRVLFLDYYNAKEFPTYEKLVISTGFEARPRGDHIFRDDELAELDQDNEDEAWIQNLDSRIHKIELIGPLDQKLFQQTNHKFSYFQSHTREVAPITREDGTVQKRFKCVLCGKMFRGEKYVHSHIEKKHDMRWKKDVMELLTLDNYIYDPQKIIPRKRLTYENRNPRFQRRGRGRGRGRRGYGRSRGYGRGRRY